MVKDFICIIDSDKDSKILRVVRFFIVIQRIKGSCSIAAGNSFHFKFRINK